MSKSSDTSDSQLILNSLEEATITKPSNSSTRDWDAIRNFYVIGEKTYTDTGSWYSADIPLTQVARHFNVPYDTVVNRARKQNWKLLREKYKTALAKNKLGREMSLYSQETYENEVTALNAATRLGKVAELYIEYKYQDLLDLANNPNKSLADLDQDTIDSLEAVNRNTGIPIFLDGVSRAAKIIEGLYKLQRTIYDNAPEVPDIEDNVDTLTETAKKAKLAQLERELGLKFEVDLN